jgi:predicted signal transduction protein with EAL and GGDEF domain
MALESLADGILMVDAQDKAVWANHSFLQLYSFPGSESLRTLRFEAIYAKAWRHVQPTPEYEAGLSVLKERQRFSGAPYVLALPHDRWVRVVELRGTQANGCSFFSHVDITVSRRQQEELRQLTTHLESLAGKDALTNLVNRRRFDAELESEWRRAHRSGSTLSLLMLDVDHFKHLNDTFGHPFEMRCSGVLPSAGALRTTLGKPSCALRRGGIRRAAIRYRLVRCSTAC